MCVNGIKDIREATLMLVIATCKGCYNKELKGTPSTKTSSSSSASTSSSSNAFTWINKEKLTVAEAKKLWDKCTCVLCHTHDHTMNKCWALQDIGHYLQPKSSDNNPSSQRSG